MSYWKARRP